MCSIYSKEHKLVHILTIDKLWGRFKGNNLEIPFTFERNSFEPCGIYDYLVFQQ